MSEKPQEYTAQQVKTKSGQMQLEVTKGGPYRFIGKSVYFRAFGNKGAGEIAAAMWKSSDWVFQELDKLSDYASDEPHNAAFLSWNHYSDEPGYLFDITYQSTHLLGYTVGRFMKPNTPVPKGMDSMDIPEGHIAKGWIKGENADIEKDISKALKKEGIYEPTSWKFMTEVYPKKEENGDPLFGYYIACRPETHKKPPSKEQKEELKASKVKKEALYAKHKDTITPRGTPVNIDLKTMTLQSDLLHHYSGDLLVMENGGGDRSMVTKETFTGPIKINLRAKTNGSDIRIYYQKGSLMLNRHKNEVWIYDLVYNTDYKFTPKQKITAGEYADIEWTISADYMAVKVNGELWCIGEKFYYIQAQKDNPPEAAHVHIAPGPDSIMTVESMQVMEI